MQTVTGKKRKKKMLNKILWKQKCGTTNCLYFENLIQTEEGYLF